MNIPCLIEPGVKYWLNHSLKECRRFNDKNINNIFNISATFALLLFICGFLFYNYKGNITREEIDEKNKLKKEYIISKLKQLAVVKRQKDSNMITDLPVWE
jgi:hypothetical protein